MVLESFRIMDYSLLLGIHRIGIDADREMHTRKLERRKSGRYLSLAEQISQAPDHDGDRNGNAAEDPTFGSTAGFDGVRDATDGGVRAKLHQVMEDGSTRELDVLVFVGVIDILQSFGVRKKLEHKWKSTWHDGSKVSVHKPKFYANRFFKYMTTRVFQPDPSSAPKSLAASVASPRAQARERVSQRRVQSPNADRAGGKGLPRSSLATAHAAPSPYFRRGKSPNGARPQSQGSDSDTAEGAGAGGARGGRATAAAAEADNARESSPPPLMQRLLISGLEHTTTDADVAAAAVLPQPSLQLAGLEHVGGTATDDIFLAALSPDQTEAVEEFLTSSTPPPVMELDGNGGGGGSGAGSTDYEEPAAGMQEQVAEARTVGGIVKRRSEMNVLGLQAQAGSPAQRPTPMLAARAPAFTSAPAVAISVARAGAALAGAAVGPDDDGYEFVSATPSPNQSPQKPKQQPHRGEPASTTAPATLLQVPRKKAGGVIKAGGDGKAVVRSEIPKAKAKPGGRAGGGGRGGRRLPVVPKKVDSEGARLKAKIEKARRARQHGSRTTSRTSNYGGSAASTPSASPLPPSSPSATTTTSTISTASSPATRTAKKLPSSLAHSRAMPQIPDPSDWDAATELLRQEIAARRAGGGGGRQKVTLAGPSLGAGAGAAAARVGADATTSDHSNEIANVVATPSGAQPAAGRVAQLQATAGIGHGRLLAGVGSPESAAGMSFFQNTSMHSDDLSFLQDRSVLASTPDILPTGGGDVAAGTGRGVAFSVLERGGSTESMVSRGSPHILPGLKRNDKTSAELDEFMALEQYALIGGSTPDLSRDVFATEV